MGQARTAAWVTAILAALLALGLGLAGPSIGPVRATDPATASPAIALAFQADPNLVHQVARTLAAPDRGIGHRLGLGAVMVRLKLFTKPEQQAVWLAENLQWFVEGQRQPLNGVTTLCLGKDAHEVDLPEAAELVAMARLGPVAAADPAEAARLATLRDRVLREMEADGLVDADALREALFRKPSLRCDGILRLGGID